MIGNIIQSYLVSLGVQIDRPGFQQADQTIRETGANIERVTSGMARNFVKAQTIIASAIAGVTASVIGLMKATANQDLAMQKYARSMMMSEDAAWRMKKATDALGESINDIALTPELLGRFNKLTADGSKMQIGGDFKSTMKDFRDLIFEFTRLKQEASYALNWVGYYLMKYLQKPLADIREKFKSFNDAVIKGMNVWTEKVARGIYHVIEVGRHFLEFIWDVGKHLKNLWDSFPKGAKVAIAAITAINVAMSAGPLGRSIMLLSTLLLLIDDYYSYMEGKEAAWGDYWDKLNEYMEIASQWYETLKREAEPYWDMVVGYAKDAAKWIGEVVTSIKEWAETTGSGLLDSFIGEVKEVATLIWDLAKAVGELYATQLKNLYSDLGKTGTIKKFKEVLEGLWGVVKDLWSAIKSVIEFITDLIKELRKSDVVREYTRSVAELWAALVDLVRVLLEAYEVIRTKFFEQIRKTALLYAFQGVLELIYAVFSNIVTTVKDVVKGITDLFKTVEQSQAFKDFWEKFGNTLDKVLWKLGKVAKTCALLIQGNWSAAKAVWDSPDPGSGGYRELNDAEKKIEPFVQAAAKKYNVDPDLIRAVAQIESGANPGALGPVTATGERAMGVMQLMPGTAKWLGVDDPMDAQQNIEGGAKYLRYLLDKYGGDEKKALAAYNWGEGYLDDLIATRGSEWQDYLPSETAKYVPNVLAAKSKYKSSSYVGKTGPLDLDRWGISHTEGGETDVSGFQPEVVDFLNELGQTFNNMGVKGIITGGSERGNHPLTGVPYHADGVYSHGNGWKVDINGAEIPQGSQQYEAMAALVAKYGGEMIYHDGHYDIVIYPRGNSGGASTPDAPKTVTGAAVGNRDILDNTDAELVARFKTATGLMNDYGYYFNAQSASENSIGFTTNEGLSEGDIEAIENYLKAEGLTYSRDGHGWYVSLDPDRINPGLYDYTKYGGSKDKFWQKSLYDYVVDDINEHPDATLSILDKVLGNKGVAPWHLVKGAFSLNRSVFGLQNMSTLGSMYQNMPAPNMNLVNGLLAGGAGSYQNYGGGNQIINVNVDVGGMTINGAGKTAAEIGREAYTGVADAGTTIGQNAVFFGGNTVNGAGGPTIC